MTRHRLTWASIFVSLASVGSSALATNINLTSGTAGSLTAPNQSFNETRGIDVSVLGRLNELVSSMTLENVGLSLAAGNVEARIYNSNDGDLVASASVGVTAGFDETVTVPISATLLHGDSYRLAFYVSAGQGAFFVPETIPYIDATGTLQINQAYESPSNSFPTNLSSYYPVTIVAATPVPEPSASAVLISAIASGLTAYALRRGRERCTPQPVTSSLSYRDDKPALPASVGNGQPSLRSSTNWSSHWLRDMRPCIWLVARGGPDRRR